MSRVELVLGGVRSGKSAHAEAAVLATGLAPIYIATAEAGDAEMRERIAAHRSRRGPPWRTVEEPLSLADRLAREGDDETAILVDCLTLWLSNLVGAGRDPEAEADRVASVLAACRGAVVLVSNEVGSGIVPDNALARRFADQQGRLNQRIAAIADTVTLVVAGLPLRLKGGTP